MKTPKKPSRVQDGVGTCNSASLLKPSCVTPQGECELSLCFSKRTWLYFLEESSQGKALIIVQFGSLCWPSCLNKENRLKQVVKGEGVFEPNVFLEELANEPKNTLRNMICLKQHGNIGKPHFLMKTWAYLP